MPFMLRDLGVQIQQLQPMAGSLLAAWLVGARLRHKHLLCRVPHRITDSL